MRTNLPAFVINSEKRKKIVKTLYAYPRRQWTCSSVEETTKIPHATVFRTLTGLKHFGVLKSVKINRKDIIYEVIDSPIAKGLLKLLYLEEKTPKKIASRFISKIEAEKPLAAVLYGSSVRGNIKPGSDIDILIILNKRNPAREKRIHDAAGQYSSQIDKTIAVAIMTLKEFRKERESPFIRSVKEHYEVLYGKDPF